MKDKSGNPNNNVSYSNFLIDNFNLDFQIKLSEMQMNEYENQIEIGGRAEC